MPARPRRVWALLRATLAIAPDDYASTPEAGRQGHRWQWLARLVASTVRLARPLAAFRAAARRRFARVRLSGGLLRSASVARALPSGAVDGECDQGAIPSSTAEEVRDLPEGAAFAEGFL